MTGTHTPVAVEVLLAGMGTLDSCSELQCPPLPSHLLWNRGWLCSWDTLTSPHSSSLHFGEGAAFLACFTPALASLPAGSSYVLLGKRGQAGQAGQPSRCPWALPVPRGSPVPGSGDRRAPRHAGDLRSRLISSAAKFINNRSGGGS